MTDIKGVIIEKNHRFSRGRLSKSSHTDIMKLDEYSIPFQLCLDKNIHLFEEISEGTEVIVQIQKKDLDKIASSKEQKALDEYSSLWSIPRIYGIRTNEKVIITSNDALWSYSTPFIPYAIFSLVVALTLFFCVILLGQDLKDLFIFLRKEFFKSKA
jgi:hypothetical protein